MYLFSASRLELPVTKREFEPSQNEATDLVPPPSNKKQRVTKTSLAAVEAAEAADAHKRRKFSRIASVPTNPTPVYSPTTSKNAMKSSVVRRKSLADAQVQKMKVEAERHHWRVPFNTCETYSAFKHNAPTIPTKPQPPTAEQIKKMEASILGTNVANGVEDMLVDPFRFEHAFFNTSPSFAKFEEAWEKVLASMDLRSAEMFLRCVKRETVVKYLRQADDKDPTTRCVMEEQCYFSTLCKNLQHEQNSDGSKVGMSFPIFPHATKDCVVKKIYQRMPSRSACVICTFVYVQYKVSLGLMTNETPYEFPNPWCMEIDVPGQLRRDQTHSNLRGRLSTWGAFPMFAEHHFLPAVDAKTGEACLHWNLPVFQ